MGEEGYAEEGREVKGTTPGIPVNIPVRSIRGFNSSPLSPPSFSSCFSCAFSDHFLIFLSFFWNWPKIWVCLGLRVHKRRGEEEGGPGPPPGGEEEERGGEGKVGEWAEEEKGDLGEPRCCRVRDSILSAEQDRSRGGGGGD